MDLIGILILGFISIFLLVQLLPLLRARLARGRRVPGLEGMLNGQQRDARRLLVYFWSPSCGMCRGMTPVIDRLASERHDVLKVNIAESMALAREFGVMATPSLAVVAQGVVTRLVVGARSKEQIRALLND